MPYRNSIVTPEWIVINLKTIIAEALNVQPDNIHPYSPFMLLAKTNWDILSKMAPKINTVFSVDMRNFDFIHTTVQAVFEYICTEYLQRKLIKKTDIVRTRQILHSTERYSMPSKLRKTYKTR